MESDLQKSCFKLIVDESPVKDREAKKNTEKEAFSRQFAPKAKFSPFFKTMVLSSAQIWTC